MKPQRVLWVMLASVHLLLPGVWTTSAQTVNPPAAKTASGPGDKQTGFIVETGADAALHRIPERRVMGGLSLDLSAFSVGTDGSESEPRWSIPLSRHGPGLDSWQPTQAGRARSVRRKILGAVVGGVGRFFGGLFLGAAIEGDRCECDDPGLVGALIGAPTGTAAGGILGYKFLF